MSISTSNTPKKQRKALAKANTNPSGLIGITPTSYTSATATTYSSTSDNQSPTDMNMAMAAMPTQMPMTPVSYSSPRSTSSKSKHQHSQKRGLLTPGLVGITPPSYSSPQPVIDDHRRHGNDMDNALGITATARDNSDANAIPSIIDTTAQNPHLQSFLGMGSPEATTKTNSGTTNVLVGASPNSLNASTTSSKTFSNSLYSTSHLMPLMEEDEGNYHHQNDDNNGDAGGTIEGSMTWGNPIDRFVHRRTAEEHATENNCSPSSIGVGIAAPTYEYPVHRNDFGQTKKAKSRHMMSGSLHNTSSLSPGDSYSIDKAASLSTSLISATSNDPNASRIYNQEKKMKKKHSLLPHQNFNSTLSQQPSPLVEPIKVFILLINPSARIFELVEIEYSDQATTLGKIIQMIPTHCTNKALGHQIHIGFCRPRGRGVSSRNLTNLSMKASGTQRDGSCARIVCGEILVAIPEGHTGKECQKLSKTILKHPKLLKILSRADPLAPVSKSKKKSKRMRRGSRRNSMTSLLSSSRLDGGDAGVLGIASINTHSTHTRCEPVAEENDEEYSVQSALEEEQKKVGRLLHRPVGGNENNKSESRQLSLSYPGTLVDGESLKLPPSTTDPNVSRDTLDSIKLKAASAAAAAAERAYTQIMEKVIIGSDLPELAKFQIMNEIADDLSLSSYQSSTSATMSLQSTAALLLQNGQSQLTSLNTEQGNLNSSIAMEGNEDKLLVQSSTDLTSSLHHSNVDNVKRKRNVQNEVNLLDQSADNTELDKTSLSLQDFEGPGNKVLDGERNAIESYGINKEQGRINQRSLDRSMIGSGDFQLPASASKNETSELGNEQINNEKDTNEPMNCDDDLSDDTLDPSELRGNTMDGIFIALSDILAYFEDKSYKNRDKALSSINELQRKMTLHKLSLQGTSILSILLVVSNLMNNRKDEFTIYVEDNSVQKNEMLKNAILWLLIVIRGERNVSKAKKSKSKKRRSKREEKSTIVRRTLFSDV